MAPRTLAYSTEGRIARITLNRPERLNAIVPAMPREIRLAVERANADDEIHVIILQGAGRAFCAGYDLKDFAEADADTPCTQSMPWDPMVDYRAMKGFTDDFFSLWRSYKPTICKVQGFAVAGGSDIALCCDLVVMAEDARIGYMPARVWGCPTTAMWVYRLGAEKAKRMLLTGDTIDGKTAKEWGLVIDAVPEAALEDAVLKLANRMAGVPKNQLMMQKLMINQAYDNMGQAACRALFAGCVASKPGWMQGAPRRQWLSHCQAVQRRRRPVWRQPSGTGSIWAHRGVAPPRLGDAKASSARLALHPKSISSHPRIEPDKLLANTQMIAALFDGITRHSPEGQWFKHYAEEKGFHEAVRLRDSGEPIPGSKSYKDY